MSLALLYIYILGRWYGNYKGMASFLSALIMRLFVVHQQTLSPRRAFGVLRSRSLFGQLPGGRSLHVIIFLSAVLPLLGGALCAGVVRRQ